MSGGRRSGAAGEALLQQALKALSQAAGQRIARHPQGHLINGRGGRLELTLQIPLGGSAGARELPTEAVRHLQDHLDGEVESLLAHRAAFRPGRILCLRCGSADCEHAAPENSRQVFAGYGATGIPQYQDFGQWLLERQHPGIDRLYQRPPRLVTDVASGTELAEDLLSAFRDPQLDYRIHGQVTAGWFTVPRRNGSAPDGVALTFQVISTAHHHSGRNHSGRSHSGRNRGRGKGRKHRKGANGQGANRKGPQGGSTLQARRRLGLNIVGAGPAGEPLAELYDRLSRGSQVEVPWARAIRFGQEALESIERSQGKKNATPEHLSGRIEGVLTGVARRLEQHRRSHDRRTGHAQKRHQEGNRPTHMALRDLTRAGDDSVLFDLRRKTLIVLGDKGRAHVWSSAGKLVTSIRYSSDSIEKKKKLEIWRQATPQEIAALRQSVS